MLLKLFVCWFVVCGKGLNFIVICKWVELFNNFHLQLVLHVHPLIYLEDIRMFNPLPHVDKFWLLLQKTFENSVIIRTICFNSFQQFYFQLKTISFFCPDVFKVVCCKFVVWGKGLIETMTNWHFSSTYRYKKKCKQK